MTTRGILRSAAVGQVFALERRPPPPDLEWMIDSHWIVSWDLRGRPAYRSAVLPHPTVHLVFEPDGGLVYGVMRRRYDRVLSGRGQAVGTKFRPGGFAAVGGRAVSALTDRVVPVEEVLGPIAAVQDDRDALLESLCARLRARVPTTRDPRIAIVQAIMNDIYTAAPGERVATIAQRHHMSVRTMQRLFSDYVGVGPKWVLQRYRMHDAVAQLDRGPSVDWARFALDLGYYDQAHFQQDFRALVGQTPARYEAEAERRASLTSRADA